MTYSSNLSQERELSYAQALYEAVEQEMQVDPSVFVFGLGVDDVKGMYGTTKDLEKRFGAMRNFDTPLSEDAMTGVAIGAALGGMRPIHVHQRMDFLLLCMNQLVNVAAKTSYAFGGHFRCRWWCGRSLVGVGGRELSTVRHYIRTSCIRRVLRSLLR